MKSSNPGTDLTSAALTTLRQVLPAEVRELSQTLDRAGFRSWVVGGSLRDVFLAEHRRQALVPVTDWDLATDARPEQITPLFKKVLPTGIAHGTVTVRLRGKSFEVTTLRGERGYQDGRHPDEVFFISDLEEDLARRDFTVNALAYNVQTGTLHDPFEGLQDLKAGLLRAVGDPAVRFAEDGLRILRAARFCSTLQMQLEESTRRALRPALPSFLQVSKERIRDEWWKALRSAQPSACFRIQAEEGLLKAVLPELWSPETDAAPCSLDEVLRALDAAPPEPVLRLALLLAGGHPAPSRALLKDWAERLRLANAERDLLTVLVEHRLGPESLEGPPLRRWLRSVGRTNIAVTVAWLAHYPAALTHNSFTLSQLEARVTEELSLPLALEVKELRLGGQELLEAGLVERGPRMGQLLQELLQRVLEEPTLNQRDSLLELARELQQK